MGASLSWAQWGALSFFFFFFLFEGGGVNILNFDIFNLKKKTFFGGWGWYQIIKKRGEDFCGYLAGGGGGGSPPFKSIYS